LFNNPFIVAVLGAHIASRLSTSTPGGFVFFILPSPPSSLLALHRCALSSFVGKKKKSVWFVKLI
jgi:hypothetical protein